MRKLVGFVVVLLLVAAPAMAAVLYEQAPHTPGAPGGNGVSAFKGTLTGVQYDRQITDDFTVGAPGWSIDKITFYGVWFTDIPGPTTVNVRFHTGGPPPGEASFAETLNAAAVTTLMGQTYFGRPGKMVELTLSPPMVLNPGTNWVNLQPVADMNWFWLTSTPTTPKQGSALYGRDPTGNSQNVGYQKTWTPSQTIFNAEYDVAFKLEGTVIPEPATLALLGLAVLALRRR